MSNVLERSFAVLELLSRARNSMPLREISEALDIPASGTHRLLRELMRLDYVRQEKEHGDYTLTTKLIAIGLSYLSETGITDLAQPILDDLATQSAELVRLGVVSGNRLTWVAKSQGAKTGLIYDPDMGADAHLASTSSGIAWLSTMSDEQALELVAKQGFAQPGQFGPNAPLTVVELMEVLHKARSDGFAMMIETFAPGMNGFAAPVFNTDGKACGVISIYGPSVRLTIGRILELVPNLLASTRSMSGVSASSPLLRRGNDDL